MTDETPPIGNNAQITAKILLELATTLFSADQKAVADDWLRAMILVRMTGPYGYTTAHEVEWMSEYDVGDQTEVVRQGAGLTKTDSFISDMVTRIFDDDVIETRVKELFGTLDDDAYTALQFYLFIVLTNIEYVASDAAIKAPSLDQVDIARWSASYLRWYRTWLQEQSDDL